MDSFLIIVSLIEMGTFYMGNFCGGYFDLQFRLMVYAAGFVIWYPIWRKLQIARGSSTPALSGRVRSGRILEVRLPDNVIVTYQLAPLIRRLQAFILDLINLFFFYVIPLGFFWWFFGGVMVRYLSEGVLMAFLQGSLIGVVVLYFLMGEGRNDGQTYGKKHMGLRVIHRTGRSVSPSEVMLRTLLRLYTFVPFLLPLEIYCFRSATLGQRLGDLAAGTLVVVDP